METLQICSFYIDILEQFLNEKGISFQQRYPDYYSNDWELKKMAIMEINAAKLYLSFKRTAEKVEGELLLAIHMHRLDYCSAYIDDLVTSRYSENSVIERCIIHYQNYLCKVYGK